MTTISRRLAAGLLLGALALPGTASAQTAACTDPHEGTSDFAELAPGAGVQRGFCAPDRDGGRDVDFFGVPTVDGHHYRVELVDRGSGFAAARLHIEDAYDQAGFVSFRGETPYSLISRRVHGGSLSFTAEALAVDATFAPVTGPDLGYTIVVTDLGPVAATGVAAIQVAPDVVRGGTSTVATITLDGAAPAGGASVTLTSSDRHVQTPATVTVPAGAEQVTAAISTSRTRRNTSVTVTAAYGAGSASKVLLVQR